MAETFGRTAARSVLIALDGAVGLTAIGGGIALLAGLEADRYPLEMLDGTPFIDYTLPGLILSVVVGGSAAIATLNTIRHPRTGAVGSIAAGAILVGWIAGEVVLLREPSGINPVEIGYAAAGTAMVCLGTWMRRAFNTAHGPSVSGRRQRIV